MSAILHQALLSSYPVAGGGGPTDPNFSNVSLLLPFDGANGSTTFTDFSPSPKTITRFGDAQISTAQSQFGGASAVFDGTGDYLESPNNSAFDFADQDFTIEMFFFVRSVGPLQSGVRGRSLVTKDVSGNRGYVLFLNSTNGVDINRIDSAFQMSNNTQVELQASVAVSFNTWHHIALQRVGSRFNIYFNGTFRNQSAITTLSLRQDTNNLRIGSWRFGFGINADFDGFIDELRITKGVARYTANFTPPSAPFPTS